MMKHICAIILTILVLAMPAAAEDWPQFRGPSGQGISSAKNVPIKWSASENVAWKKEMPGQGWSSPVLMGGKIYFTSAIVEGNAPTSLRALCVDAKSGESLWNKEVFHRAAVPSIKHDKNSFASPTPIVENGCSTASITTLSHKLILPADTNHHDTLYAGSLMRIALDTRSGGRP
jgi:hypothetical protein